MDSFTGGIALVSFGVAIFLAVILFSGEGSASRALGLLLAIHSVGFLLRFSFAIGSSPIVYIPFVFFPLIFLYGPLLLYYTRASLFRARIGRGDWFLGAVPAVLIFFVYLWLYLNFDEFSQAASVAAQAGPVLVFTRVLLILAVGHCFFFLVRAVRAIVLYGQQFEAGFSSDDRSRTVWLRLFLGLNFFMLLAYSGLALLSALGWWRIPVTPVDGLILLALIYLVLYHLVRKPHIFAITRAEDLPRAQDGEVQADVGAPDPGGPEASQEKSGPKYARQTLPEATRKEYLERIQTRMRNEKPFLDEELSLTELSGSLGIPAHHFSMVINIELGLNFFNFVSGYRVQEARRLLADPALREDTILSIAFRSGFQSKAAFNKAFKAETGLTPGDYRKQFLNVIA